MIARLFACVTRNISACFPPDILPVIPPVTSPDIHLLSARTDAPHACRNPFEPRPLIFPDKQGITGKLSSFFPRMRGKWIARASARDEGGTFGVGPHRRVVYPPAALRADRAARHFPRKRAKKNNSSAVQPSFDFSPV
jgi:hypothetical protein